MYIQVISSHLQSGSVPQLLELILFFMGSLISVLPQLMKYKCSILFHQHTLFFFCSFFLLGGRSFCSFESVLTKRIICKTMKGLNKKLCSLSEAGKLMEPISIHNCRWPSKENLKMCFSFSFSLVALLGKYRAKKEPMQVDLLLLVSWFLVFIKQMFPLACM